MPNKGMSPRHPHTPQPHLIHHASYTPPCSRQTSGFAATCAANEAVDDAVVRGFVQALLVAWLRDAGTGDAAMAFVPRLAAQFPQLHVTFAVN